MDGRIVARANDFTVDTHDKLPRGAGGARSFLPLLSSVTPFLEFVAQNASAL